MSLLSDIKQFLGRYLKNRALIIAGAYILYRYITKHKKKEGFSERVDVIDDTDETPYSIIYDNRTQKYIMIYNDRVFSADNEEDLYKMIGR